MIVTLWRVNRWRYNNVIWWTLCDRPLETPLWSHYDHGIVTSKTGVTSYWSHLGLFNDCHLKCLVWSHGDYYFLESHQVTSFWYHLGTRHKATFTMTSQKRLEITVPWELPDDFIATSPWRFVTKQQSRWFIVGPKWR